jgi:hypothetical protein
LVKSCQNGSIKTLLHDSKIGLLSGAEMWDLKDKERKETGNTARGVPQVSNFTTDMSLN